jgi:bacteriophage HK97-gp10 putative tail-component
MAKNGLSVKVKGQAEIARNIGYLKRNFPQWLAAANEATAQDIADNAERNIREIDAYDTGELYGSIEIKSAKNGLDYAVGSTAEHAPFIEFGTAPHFPPVDAIRDWCIRKGLPASAAFPIARAISERGLPERPFLRPAFLAAQSEHVNRVRTFAYLGMKGILKK